MQLNAKARSSAAASIPPKPAARASGGPRSPLTKASVGPWPPSAGRSPLLLAGLSVVIGVVEHARATSLSLANLGWHLDTDWAFVIAMLLVTACTRAFAEIDGLFHPRRFLARKQRIEAAEQFLPAQAVGGDKNDVTRTVRLGCEGETAKQGTNSETHNGHRDMVQRRLRQGWVRRIIRTEC